MLFKLLAGQHVMTLKEGGRKTFKVGDLVESEVDLVRLCGKDKFALVPTQVKEEKTIVEVPTTFEEEEVRIVIPEKKEDKPLEPIEVVKEEPPTKSNKRRKRTK